MMLKVERLKESLCACVLVKDHLTMNKAGFVALSNGPRTSLVCEAVESLRRTRVFDSIFRVAIDNALLVNIYSLHPARAFLNMILSCQLPNRYIAYSTETFRAAIESRGPLARWIGKPNLKRPS